MAQVNDQIFGERRAASTEKLAALTKALSVREELKGLGNLSIYVTGSFGREEASAASDLDLFFIQAPDASGKLLGRIDKILMDAAVIGETRKLGFPEFSGDGAYLDVHNLKQMLEKLGSPADDHENLFTARLLLLLESKPVLNEPVYDEALEQIVSRYYRDYHNHPSEFIPVFLTNDMIRFWKTLCLNYEHARKPGSEDAVEKAKAQLKNLKLKFSRMLTCFSGIAALCEAAPQLDEERVLSVVKTSPVRRLQSVAEENVSVRPLIEQMLEEYAWFLRVTGVPKAEALAWIADQTVREDAFARGKRFGELMHDVVVEVATPNGLARYLLV